LRASPIGFPVAVGCAAIAMGFATATLKSHLIEHTILLAPAYSVSVSGFVEAREERERSDRIVVRVAAMEAARLGEKPDRIRLTVRKGAAPAVGAFISLRARLIWSACQDDDFGRIIKLLMLTACRRDEIGGLFWSEIDFDRAMLNIPGTRSKNH